MELTMPMDDSPFAQESGEFAQIPQSQDEEKSEDTLICQNRRVPLDSENKDGWECKFWGKVLETNGGLGGHVSGAHKGESEIYKKKMEIRNAR